MGDSEFQDGFQRKAKAWVLVLHVGKPEGCGGAAAWLPYPSSIAHDGSHLMGSCGGRAHGSKAIKSWSYPCDDKPPGLLGRFTKLGDDAPCPAGPQEPELLHWDSAAAPSCKIDPKVLRGGLSFELKASCCQPGLQGISIILR